MKSQKGISVARFLSILILCVFFFIGYYVYLQGKEKAFNVKSQKELNALYTKISDKMEVAKSTPKIGLGAVLNDLATLKSDVSNLQVSKCLEPAKQSLQDYVSANLAVMIDFSSNKLGDDPEEWLPYTLKINGSKQSFDDNLKKCNPK